jgi:23S rRNA pseudouridine1911/1915/1917 synthase
MGGETIKDARHIKTKINDVKKPNDAAKTASAGAPDAANPAGPAGIEKPENAGLSGQSFSAEVPPTYAPPKRLDRYIAEDLRLFSRAQIKARKLAAFVNGKSVKISRLLSGGDKITLFWEKAPDRIVVPENIPLKILYEDERVVVVNKKTGMVTHPAAGNWNGTLMNALLAHKKLEAQEDVRSFIAHRLDKDTSGVIICAYTKEAVFFLSSQFKKRAVKKTYYAVVQGEPLEKQGVINKRIRRDKRDRKKFEAFDSPAPPTQNGENAGKKAVTRYKTLKTFAFLDRKYSLLTLRPKTGRTHQIRVHLRSIGVPVLGDPVYGFKDRIFSGLPLMLHAARLCIRIAPGEDPKIFRAPLPKRFRLFLKKAAKQRKTPV